MKTALALPTTLIAFCSLCYSQNLPAEVVSALQGKFSWVSYSGGLGGLPATPPTAYYDLVFVPNGTSPNLTWSCDGYKNSTLQFTRSLTFSADTTDLLMPYHVQPDVLNLLIGSGDTSGIDFRIISNDSIEFTHKDVNDDFSYLFVHNCCNVSVKTGSADVFGGSLPWDQLYYQMDSVSHLWVCGGEGYKEGLTIAVLNSTGCSNWISRYPSEIGTDPVTGSQYNYVYGNIHCRDRDLNAFDFPTFDPLSSVKTDSFQQRIVRFLNAIPDSDYVLVYSINTAWYQGWSQQMVASFVNLGSQAFDSSSTSLLNGNTSPWVFFVQKGSPQSAIEQIGNSITDILQFNTTFNCLDLDIDTTQIDTTEAISDVALNAGIEILPNPASEMVQIKTTVIPESITLSNTLGEELMKMAPSSRQTTVSLDNLEKGFYLVRIKLKEGVLTRKLVIR